MRMYEKQVTIPRLRFPDTFFSWGGDRTYMQLHGSEVPIRFAITDTDSENHTVELGILLHNYDTWKIDAPGIFDYQERAYKRSNEFNVALMIPTGIGCEIGGHAGDAGAVAIMLSEACDHLITHPNVVNASDINELPKKDLYVEGSVFSSLFMGTASLRPVRANRILLVVEDHLDKRLSEYAVNAASAAHTTMGMDLDVVMAGGFNIKSRYSESGRATGEINGLEALFETIEKHIKDYDAIAIASVIQVPEGSHSNYYKDTMINPWGGAEAMLTHAISIHFGLPCAHAPMMESHDIYQVDVGIVDPRQAAEVLSVAFLHSVLKGLHRAPQIIRREIIGEDEDCYYSIEHFGEYISARDIDCLVIPDGVVGLPVLAAIKQGIPVIAVRENKNLMNNDLTLFPFDRGKVFMVDNYLEAVGVITALKAGVKPDAVRRPIYNTRILG